MLLLVSGLRFFEGQVACARLNDLPRKYLSLGSDASLALNLLTRSEGECSAFTVAEIIWNDCERIYGTEFLDFLGNDSVGRICECKVSNPDELLGYFHYIQISG